MVSRLISDPMPDLLVIRGDCQLVLADMPVGIIGLTVTDPPYESQERHRKIGTTTRLKKSKSSSNPWFEIFKNTEYFSLLCTLHRLHQADTHCYIFCDNETEHVILSGRNPFDEKLDHEMMDYMDVQTNCSAPPAKWGGWQAWPSLDWVKTKRAKSWKEVENLDDSDIHSGMGYHWRRCGERILFLEKGKRKLNQLGWKDHLLGPRAGKDEAPTQKPTTVVERLILNSTSPGDMVLDPFAGSGVVGQMALRHGRRAILIDTTLQWMGHEKWPEAVGKHVEVIEWT